MDNNLRELQRKYRRGEPGAAKAYIAALERLSGYDSSGVPEPEPEQKFVPLYKSKAPSWYYTSNDYVNQRQAECKTCNSWGEVVLEGKPPDINWNQDCPECYGWYPNKYPDM